MPRSRANVTRGRFTYNRAARHSPDRHGHAGGGYIVPSPGAHTGHYTGHVGSSRPSGGSTYASLFRLFEYSGTERGGDVTSARPAVVAPTTPVRNVQPKPDAADKDVLTVVKVDLNVLENVKKHNTDKYDIAETADPLLVLRRGQDFTVQIDFNRQYNEKNDDLRLVFEIGDQPKPSKGTHVEFILSDKDVPGQWGAKLVRQAGNSVWITFFTAPDCIVGKWQLKVDVVKKSVDNVSVFRYTHKDPIYMLFNPWCKEDLVYMENAAQREEYVLNETGKIYVGSQKQITGKPWVFGQFHGKVLDCCMHLLDVSQLNIAVRGNPIPVVRKLTAMVNSQDEGGVLTGNWSGEYAGGKSPLSWTGSAVILEQYYEQKFSVQFGQCWVFSGVLTTILRALGIPARSVTNFASAHDCDQSITIDLHFDELGNPEEDKNEDSVWNFHVWNEAWMARPDLPTGYGGWQACDATPQETSDSVYCCGPVSVRAIREGEVNLPYDGPFIFAEVNADKVYWMCYKDGRNENCFLEKNAIGKFISTKAVNSGEREDVTGLYKFPEGTAEERVAVRRANQVGSSRKNVYKEGPTDVEFSLVVDNENTWVGKDFVVLLRAKNTNANEARQIKGRTVVSTMYYTGVSADTLATEPFDNITLKPGETQDVRVSVPPSAYLRKLKDCCMLCVSAMAKVDETEQIFTKKDDFRLRKPHATVKAPKTGKVGEEFEAQVSFTNTLPCTLNDCYLEVDGPCLPKATRFPQGDVQAKGTFLVTLKLKPVKAGECELVFIFNCNELEDVNGTHQIDVKP